MELGHVTKDTIVSSKVHPAMYNELADYANKSGICNMSAVVRQAVVFFLEKKARESKFTNEQTSKEHVKA